MESAAASLKLTRPFGKTLRAPKGDSLPCDLQPSLLARIAQERDCRHYCSILRGDLLGKYFRSVFDVDGVTVEIDAFKIVTRPGDRVQNWLIDKQAGLTTYKYSSRIW